VAISNSNPVVDLTGRGALVTGAGAPGGIGFATAKMLAELGAKVFLTSASARCVDRANELCDEGFQASALAGDLTNTLHVESIVHAAAEFLSTLDIVVNNAGMTSLAEPMQVAETGDATVIDQAAFANTLERNLTSAFAVTRLALPGQLIAVDGGNSSAEQRA
jgi:3-oxoacyl-[acyl-carrier protein] reductase